MLSVNNYIYEGYISHRRYTPMSNVFKYPIFMTYFDISKIDELFKKKSLLTNIDKPSFISFYREDYHDNSVKCLDDAVRNTLKNKYDYIAKGPIRILTHLRYFGYCFNPVSFYYCFDEQDKKVESILAEITNTPWNERYTYFISDQDSKSNLISKMKKEFHVSPFWDMDHKYDWTLTPPEKKLTVKMKNYKDNQKVFDAFLNLKRKKLSINNLLLQTIRYPFITLRIFLKIHWQAAKLWFKGATFYTHPSKAK